MNKQTLKGLKIIGMGALYLSVVTEVFYQQGKLHTCELMAVKNHEDVMEHLDDMDIFYDSRKYRPIYRALNKNMNNIIRKRINKDKKHN